MKQVNKQDITIKKNGNEVMVNKQQLKYKIIFGKLFSIHYKLLI